MKIAPIESFLKNFSCSKPTDLASDIRHCVAQHD
jgi:TIR domain